MTLERNELNKIKILNSCFKDILIKDIVKRHNVRKVEKLQELAKYYLSNIPSLHSFNRMKKFLKVSLDTIERFSRYLKIASFYLLGGFSYSLESQIVSPRKVYTIDLGLGFFTALGFKFSENIEKLMENLVAIELFRRKSYYNQNPEIFHFKTREGYEVDFLIKEGNKIKQLINATYSNSFDEIDPREWRGLLHANDLFKKDKPELIIITWDYGDEREFS